MLANLQIDTEVLQLIIIFRKQLVRVTPNEDAENLQNTHPQGHSWLAVSKVPSGYYDLKITDLNINFDCKILLGG